jgi:hypothetical protein
VKVLFTRPSFTRDLPWSDLEPALPGWDIDALNRTRSPRTWPPEPPGPCVRLSDQASWKRGRRPPGKQLASDTGR